MLGTLRRKERISRAAWDRREVQQKRFDAVCDLGDFHARRLLDAGCGAGDLLDHLLKWETIPDYTGLDRCARSIERCKNRFEDRLGPACRFLAADVLQYAPARKFEYVVASALFGPYPGEGLELSEAALRRLFAWCAVGLAASLPEAESERTLAMALRLTPAVRLSHNYLPHESMLYLYRTPAWDEAR